jgi:glycosyltransferase involved in cell wall biosynthesis
MFVSGFTFVRNAIKYDYPIIESISSLLPLVDELIVCLGNSDDGTEELIKSINNPKIKIVQSVWDDTLREGGKVLAVETDKALDSVNPKANWCIYLQADEVLHEDDYKCITSAMKQHLSNKEIEGLLFSYIHFYGSYHYVGDSRKWYRREIRIVRNGIKVRSFKDAQGFRIDDRKLHVKRIDARVFHYGWVKNPNHQLEKQKSFHKLWHSDEAVKKKVKEEPFDYSEIDSLKKFDSNHPATMKDRINSMNWDFNFDTKKKQLSFKDGFLYFIEKFTGYRLFEYKNYKLK